MARLLLSNPFGYHSESACTISSRLAIVECDQPMYLKILTVTALVLALTGPAVARDQRGEAKSQVEFGIQVAQRGLWKEALYRWQRAVDLDPSYAAAYNDLAIAYEHEGQLDKAREAYEKAVELEPNNLYIRQNYDLFKEINDRANSEDRR